MQTRIKARFPATVAGNNKAHSKPLGLGCRKCDLIENLTQLGSHVGRNLYASLAARSIRACKSFSEIPKNPIRYPTLRICWEANNVVTNEAANSRNGIKAIGVSTTAGKYCFNAHRIRKFKPAIRKLMIQPMILSHGKSCTIDPGTITSRRTMLTLKVTVNASV